MLNYNDYLKAYAYIDKLDFDALKTLGEETSDVILAHKIKQFIFVSHQQGQIKTFQRLYQDLVHYIEFASSQSPVFVEIGQDAY